MLQIAAELATPGEISAVVEAAQPGKPGPLLPNSPVEYSCTSLTNADTPCTSTHSPFALSFTHYLQPVVLWLPSWISDLMLPHFKIEYTFLSIVDLFQEVIYKLETNNLFYKI